MVCSECSLLSHDVVPKLIISSEGDELGTEYVDITFCEMPECSYRSSDHVSSFDLNSDFLDDLLF